jgi:hypothetical protein
MYNGPTPSAPSVGATTTLDEEEEIPIAFNSMSALSQETQRLDIALQQSELDMCKNDLVMKRLTEDAMEKAATLDDALANLKMQQNQLEKERDNHKTYSSRLLAEVRMKRNAMEQHASTLKAEKERLKSRAHFVEASPHPEQVAYVVNIGEATPPTTHSTPSKQLPHTKSRSKNFLRSMSRLVNG